MKSELSIKRIGKGNPAYSKKCSIENRKKISKSMLGVVHSVEAIKKEILTKKIRRLCQKNRNLMLKVGLDFHGVIDFNPKFFSKFSKEIINSGEQVHIITGKKDTPEFREKIKRLGIFFTHFFSITSYHESIRTPIHYDEKGHPWMDPEIWNRTKADYCQRMKITMHIDDSTIYGKYFNKIKTVYLLYKKPTL